MQSWSCCSIIVIIFENQHLEVCGSFSASDGTWWYEILEQNNMWAIKNTQPCIPFLGPDLIWGTAASGSSSLTAIKLGMILKMLGMNKTWRCQKRDGDGETGSAAMAKRSSLYPLETTFRLMGIRSKCHLPDQFSSTLHLLWWDPQDTHRLWSLGAAKSYSYCCLSGVNVQSKKNSPKHTQQK